MRAVAWGESFFFGGEGEGFVDLISLLYVCIYIYKFFFFLKVLFFLACLGEFSLFSSLSFFLKRCSKGLLSMPQGSKYHLRRYLTLKKHPNYLPF